MLNECSQAGAPHWNKPSPMTASKTQSSVNVTWKRRIRCCMMQQWEQGSTQEMTAESEPQAWHHREDNHAVLGCVTIPIFRTMSHVYYSSRPTLSDRAVQAGVLSPGVTHQTHLVQWTWNVLLIRDYPGASDECNPCSSHPSYENPLRQRRIPEEKTILERVMTAWCLVDITPPRTSQEAKKRRRNGREKSRLHS